jgi:catechol 2,3-dioxygenase-like lactoylglutathione lyase family enzyme
MLSSSELICFAATKNPEAAKSFYVNTLDLMLIEDSPFALVFDANGTTLRIQKVHEHTPAKHTALGWRVADIRSEMGQLIRKGVHFERYEGLHQDEFGIWKSPSGALVAWFLDPDGNGLSLTQYPAQQSAQPDRCEGAAPG